MDSKQAIGKRLKEAREQAGISIQDIASSTRINIKFLKEIEQGIVPDVPETYLRAFVKAFAEQVERDPAEFLKEYFAVEAPPPPPREEPEGRPVVEPGNRKPPPRKVTVKESQSSSQRQVKVLFVISAAMIGTLGILIFFLRDSRPDRPVQEIPFSDVIKERESSQPAQNVHADSASEKNPALKSSASDTLRLDAVASESVWVHIVIDNALTKEYVLTPKRRLQWKGKKSFLISVGNVSAIALTLNGVKLDALGIPQKPATNVLLSRETMKHYVNKPPRKDKG